jgi:hypothetical protein
VPTLHSSIQLESLNFILVLNCLEGALMDPMWDDYDKV